MTFNDKRQKYVEDAVKKIYFDPTDRLNLLQKSYFVYNHSSLVKNSFISKIKKFLPIYCSVRNFSKKRRKVKNYFELKNIELSNISDAYSTTNTMKIDISNDRQKHLLCKQYVVWHCNGYTAAPISDYINNPVFQELLLQTDYLGDQTKGYILT